MIIRLMQGLSSNPTVYVFNDNRNIYLSAIYLLYMSRG